MLRLEFVRVASVAKRFLILMAAGLKGAAGSRNGGYSPPAPSTMTANAGQSFKGRRRAIGGSGCLRNERNAMRPGAWGFFEARGMDGGGPLAGKRGRVSVKLAPMAGPDEVGWRGGKDDGPPGEAFVGPRCGSPSTALQIPALRGEGGRSQSHPLGDASGTFSAAYPGGRKADRAFSSRAILESLPLRSFAAGPRGEKSSAKRTFIGSRTGGGISQKALQKRTPLLSRPGCDEPPRRLGVELCSHARRFLGLWARTERFVFMAAVWASSVQRAFGVPSALGGGAFVAGGLGGRTDGWVEAFFRAEGGERGGRKGGLEIRGFYAAEPRQLRFLVGPGRPEGSGKNLFRRRGPQNYKPLYHARGMRVRGARR